MRKRHKKKIKLTSGTVFNGPVFSDECLTCLSGQIGFIYIQPIVTLGLGSRQDPFIVNQLIQECPNFGLVTTNEDFPIPTDNSYFLLKISPGNLTKDEYEDLAVRLVKTKGFRDLREHFGCLISLTKESVYCTRFGFLHRKSRKLFRVRF